MSRPHAEPSNGRNLEGEAVRLTFKTDTPFYPYREPADLRESLPATTPTAPPELSPGSVPEGNAGRELKVFLLSDQRYEGRLGAKDRWPAQTMWADQIPASLFARAADALQIAPASLLTPGDGVPYLTEFVDISSPRPGTEEVYFDPLPGMSPLERPPVIHVRHVTVYWPGRSGAIWIAGAAAIAGIGAVAYGSWLSGSRRRHQPATD